MADVLQRTTKEQRFSVHTPDYDPAIWIINPDLSGVVGVPKKYWKIEGDTVSEMNQSEKDAVDATLLPGIKEVRKSYLRTTADNLVENQGYTDGIQRSILAHYSKNKGRKTNKAEYLEDWNDWIEQVDTEVETKQALVDDQTTINAVNDIYLDSSTLINSDPNISLATAIDTTDSTDLDSFIDANAIVTDSYTNKTGPFYLMQILEHRREIFNDSTNPLYLADHTAILGDDGYLVNHANRINNIETIHGKLGWHEQEVTQAAYTRPKDLLIYYGWLNSFNSGQHGWDNEKVSQEMAQHRMLVFGDGIQNPGHGDYANTEVIIPRIKELNNYSEIYGYVTVNQSYGDFTTKVNQWDDLEVHGIFMDEAGYDYGKTRAEFNQRVDYVHDRTYASKCFVNSWNTDHVLGTANDPSYPNSTYNDSSTESNLNNTDWILLESFPINTSSYTDSTPQGYESASDWLYRGDKMKSLRNSYGVNFAGAGVINNDNTDGTALFNFGFVSAMMYNLEAYGTSDTLYGSSSSAVKRWVRPDVTKLGTVYCLDCTVKVDGNDSSVYHRYVENGKLTLDFSDGAQLSTILKY